MAECVLDIDLEQTDNEEKTDTLGLSLPTAKALIFTHGQEYPAILGVR